MEIIEKYQSFKTKDAKTNIGKNSSSLKQGKILMTLDIFSKFTKLSKEVLLEKSGLVLGGKY